MALSARLDHIAVAVPDAEAASQLWRDTLGGRLFGSGANELFGGCTYQYRGGGKLELIAPGPASNGAGFVDQFLERFGCQVHHVNLSVTDLKAALAELEQAGLDAIDVNFSAEHKPEAFLKPVQTGKVLVQLVEESAPDPGLTAEATSDPIAFLGATLAFPDLNRARDLWECLGATVTRGGGRLECRWPDSPLTLWIVEGDAGPRVLRMAGGRSLPAQPGRGPAVEMISAQP